MQDWLITIGHEVLLTCEPSNRPVGKFIQKALSSNSPESDISDRVLPFLFAADRQDHLESEIFPALLAGKSVVSDRYYHSSLAYQGLSAGFDRVVMLNKSFRPPDITFFLWLEPEVSFSRIQHRGQPIERFETLDRLRSISDAYETVFSYCKSQNEIIHKIDASLSIEEIQKNIQDKVLDLQIEE